MIRGLIVFLSFVSFASFVSSTEIEKPATSCSDGSGLDYTLTTFNECKKKLHPNGSMVQTFPKLVPYSTFTEEVACPRRGRPGAPRRTPGHRVCRFADCHSHIYQNGWCEETMTGFKCHCFAGYEGKRCDQQSTSKQNITAITLTENTPYPTTTSLKHASCPFESWTSFQGSCYKYFGKKLSFPEAVSFCQSSTNEQSCPVDLISIHSPEENDLPLKLCFNDTDCVKSQGIVSAFWIGLYQPVPDSDFVWSDGSPVNYTSWSLNEPNNGEGTEDCAYSYIVSIMPMKSLWNDYPCHLSLSFVCKHPVLCHGISTALP